MALDFIEPWIVNAPENFGKLLPWLHKLGYSGCIIEGIGAQDLKEVSKKVLTSDRFTTFTRKTLETNKKNPPNLDQIRNQVDFLTFFCSNAEITKWACQDQRIDNLLFPIKEFHRLVDDSTINLVNENKKSIEVDFSSIISDKYPIAQLRNIIKVVYKATKKDVPLIFSSKAKTIEMVRSPYSLIGFLNFVGFPLNYYQNISQPWLTQRLKRNISRKSDSFISPGLWVTSEDDLS